MLTYNGGVLVSTFEGEGNDQQFWTAIKSSLAHEGIKITFTPAFISFRDPSQTRTLLSTFLSIDEFSDWWPWCVRNNSASQMQADLRILRRPNDVNTLLTTYRDIAYRDPAHSRGGPYIMYTSCVVQGLPRILILFRLSRFQGVQRNLARYLL